MLERLESRTLLLHTSSLITLTMALDCTGLQAVHCTEAGTIGTRAPRRLIVQPTALALAGSRKSFQNSLSHTANSLGVPKTTTRRRNSTQKKRRTTTEMKGEKVSPTTNRVVIRMIEWGSVHSVVYVSGCTRHATSFYGQKRRPNNSRRGPAVSFVRTGIVPLANLLAGQSWSDAMGAAHQYRCKFWLSFRGVEVVEVWHYSHLAALLGGGIFTLGHRRAKVESTFFNVS